MCGSVCMRVGVCMCVSALLGFNICFYVHWFFPSINNGLFQIYNSRFNHIFLPDKLSSNWQVEEIFEMLQLLACIQTEKLQQHKIAR